MAFSMWLPELMEMLLIFPQTAQLNLRIASDKKKLIEKTQLVFQQNLLSYML